MKPPFVPTVAAWLMLAWSAAFADTPVPGACQSPDLARFANDEDRHAAIRGYLLCLNEQSRATESASGTLGRQLPPGFDSREPMVRPYDPRSGGSERYPDDRGRVLR